MGAAGRFGLAAQRTFANVCFGSKAAIATLAAGMGGQRTLAFVLGGLSVSFAPQFPIRLVNCLKQAGEAGSFIDWPRTTEAVAKQT